MLAGLAGLAGHYMKLSVRGAPRTTFSAGSGLESTCALAPAFPRTGTAGNASQAPWIKNAGRYLMTLSACFA